MEEKKELQYSELLRKAEIFDYTPSRGSIVLRPYGWKMWQSVQENLGRLLKTEAEAEDVYFPALIPQELIEKEKEHIKGFSPELLKITIGGKDTGLCLRPTSETIIYSLFSRWIQSYTDLPMIVNQWCAVYRAELRTYPFLRTREFLWQELHAAHRTYEEASNYVRKVLDLYLKFIEDHLAFTAVSGLKTEKEKFPGAEYTTTLEAFPQNKALQVATSHNLGTGFSEAFEVRFLDKDNKLKSVVLTSHGVSWRVLGAMFLSHQDERGIILPPKIAPYQIVIIPVFGGKKTDEALKKAEELSKTLKEEGIRVKVDRREDKSLGFKHNFWDAKGVPLKIVIGDREMENKSYEVIRRDKGLNDRDQRTTIPFETNISLVVKEKLEAIQNDLLQRSRQHLNENIEEVDDEQKLKEILETRGGMGAVFLCGNRKCEDRLKEFKASVRCVPFRGKQEKGKCIFCGQPSSYGKRVLVAKAY